MRTLRIQHHRHPASVQRRQTRRSQIALPCCLGCTITQPLPELISTLLNSINQRPPGRTGRLNPCHG
jgi:hypothetical protein